uniref:Uncharacterized protein n=1 Tax=Anguilla anguilla TaxID=7936 RepID=A0A0E9PBU9_ANGAN
MVTSLIHSLYLYSAFLNFRTLKVLYSDEGELASPTTNV